MYIFDWFWYLNLLYESHDSCSYQCFPHQLTNKNCLSIFDKSLHFWFCCRFCAISAGRSRADLSPNWEIDATLHSSHSNGRTLHILPLHQNAKRRTNCRISYLYFWSKIEQIEITKLAVLEIGRNKGTHNRTNMQWECVWYASLRTRHASCMQCELWNQLFHVTECLILVGFYRYHVEKSVLYIIARLYDTFLPCLTVWSVRISIWRNHELTAWSFWFCDTNGWQIRKDVNFSIEMVGSNHVFYLVLVKCAFCLFARAPNPCVSFNYTMF